MLLTSSYINSLGIGQHQRKASGGRCALGRWVRSKVWRGSSGSVSPIRQGAGLNIFRPDTRCCRVPRPKAPPPASFRRWWNVIGSCSTRKGIIETDTTSKTPPLPSRPVRLCMVDLQIHPPDSLPFSSWPELDYLETKLPTCLPCLTLSLAFNRQHSFIHFIGEGPKRHVSSLTRGYLHPQPFRALSLQFSSTYSIIGTYHTSSYSAWLPTPQYSLYKHPLY